MSGRTHLALRDHLRVGGELCERLLCRSALVRVLCGVQLLRHSLELAERLHGRRNGSKQGSVEPAPFSPWRLRAHRASCTRALVCARFSRTRASCAGQLRCRLNAPQHCVAPPRCAAPPPPPPPPPPPTRQRSPLSLSPLPPGTPCRGAPAGLWHVRVARSSVYGTAAGPCPGRPPPFPPACLPTCLPACLPSQLGASPERRTRSTPWPAGMGAFDWTPRPHAHAHHACSPRISLFEKPSQFLMVFLLLLPRARRCAM